MPDLVQGLAGRQSVLGVVAIIRCLRVLLSARSPTISDVMMGCAQRPPLRRRGSGGGDRNLPPLGDTSGFTTPAKGGGLDDSTWETSSEGGSSDGRGRGRGGRRRRSGGGGSGSGGRGRGKNGGSGGGGGSCGSSSTTSPHLSPRPLTAGTGGDGLLFAMDEDSVD